MKTVKSTINSVHYKRDLAFEILDINELTSGMSISNEKPLVFLDTNILLWFFKINEDARKEVFSILNTLKDSNRLHIPTWVIHEYNYQLERESSSTFFPFKKTANELEPKLKYLEKHSNLIVDDAYLNGSPYKGKEDFLTSLDKTVNELIDLCI